MCKGNIEVEPRPRVPEPPVEQMCPLCSEVLPVGVDTTLSIQSRPSHEG